MKTKKLKSIILIAIIDVGLTVAYADEATTSSDVKTITKNWQCKWCPKVEPAATKGYVIGRVGTVSNDSYQQGDYVGLDEKGAYAAVDAAVNISGNSAAKLEIDASDVGLDSQNIGIRGGRQGNYSAEIKYEQIPKLNEDTTRTPFSGSTNKILPTTWVSGSTTVDFSTLADDLHDEDIKTRRDNFSIAASYYQSPKISYDLAYRHDTKEGNRTLGVALGSTFVSARAVIMPVPVDYVTDNVKATINYRDRRASASLSFETSKFTNNNESMQWENPFTEPVGVDSGQISLAPDNAAQSVSLLGSYQVSKVTTASGYLSMGEMLQDETFLPYTVNAALVTSTLPRSSLDGKINTVKGGVNVNSRINEKLKLYFKYGYEEQDNNTARATYDYVTADTILTLRPRANFPYSFRKQQIDVKLGYPIQIQSTLTAGVNTQQNDRTYQEISRSRETSVWGKLAKKLGDKTEAWLRIARSDRTGDTYTAVDEIDPPENTLLKKYNLADRLRNQLNFGVSYSPIEKIDLNFSIDLVKNDFENSELGLMDSNEKNYNFDVGYRITRQLSAAGYLSLAQLDSSQKGSTWSANNDERFKVFGLSFNYEIVDDKLNIKLDYVAARTIGETSFSSGNALPDVTIDRDTFSLVGDYKLREKLSVSMLLRYEKYDESDWMTDSVVANTIPNVLTLGEKSPSYDIGIFAVGLRYAF